MSYDWKIIVDLFSFWFDLQPQDIRKWFLKPHSKDKDNATIPANTALSNLETTNSEPVSLFSVIYMIYIYIRHLCLCYCIKFKDWINYQKFKTCCFYLVVSLGADFWWIRLWKMSMGTSSFVEDRNSSVEGLCTNGDHHQWTKFGVWQKAYSYHH